MESRLIPLTQGQFAIVDAEDYEHLSNFRWHAQWKAHAKKFYVNGYPESGYRAMKMHSFLMKPKPGQFVDHINRNPLDNRRCNLRLLSHADNCLNRLRPNKFSPGVHSSHGRFVAFTIGIRPRLYLGTFENIQDAVVAQIKAGSIIPSN